MNRVAAIVVTLAVVAGSVPAAAALGTGVQADGTASGAEPGATFAGVIGVQEAEVDSEVAQRALDRQFAAAETNGSKARVVADQQEQLTERLDQLEAEKARLDRAYENGSIGQAQYQARLAGLAAEIRALERQANRTATVAESLPGAALREHGANASRVRSIAQQADRSGGGEVAEAAREIAGESVGNGLGPPNGSERGPPNGSERGPPDRAGPNGNSTEAGNGQRPNGTSPGEGQGPGQAPNDTGQPNATDRPNANGVGGNGSAGGAANGTAGPSNGVGDGQNTANGRSTTETGGEPRNAGNGTADVTNRTDGNATAQQPRNASGTNGTDGDTTNGNGANGDDTGEQPSAGTPTPTPAATRTA